MHTHPLGKTLALAALLVVLVVPIAWASGANFVLSAAGVDLGKPKVESDKVVYTVKAEVGKPFTLTAQARVYGRGDEKGSPSKPESGAWKIDEKALEKVTPDKDKKPHESEVVVTLKPTKAGTSRVTFEGKVLGYKRTFEVVIEAAEAKK